MSLLFDEDNLKQGFYFWISKTQIMNDDIINEKIQTISMSSIWGFFAWFWRIKKSEDIDRVNILLDNIFERNFLIIKNTFKDYNEVFLYKKYLSELKKLVGNWKNRYIKCNL